MPDQRPAAPATCDFRIKSSFQIGNNASPQVRPEEVELIRRDYTANGGWETFLEYGDPRQVRAPPPASPGAQRARAHQAARPAQRMVAIAHAARAPPPASRSAAP